MAVIWSSLRGKQINRMAAVTVKMRATQRVRGVKRWKQDTDQGNCGSHRVSPGAAVTMFFLLLPSYSHLSSPLPPSNLLPLLLLLSRFFSRLSWRSVPLFSLSSIQLGFFYIFGGGQLNKVKFTVRALISISFTGSLLPVWVWLVLMLSARGHAAASPLYFAWGSQVPSKFLCWKHYTHFVRKTIALNYYFFLSGKKSIVVLTAGVICVCMPCLLNESNQYFEVLCKIVFSCL